MTHWWTVWATDNGPELDPEAAHVDEAFGAYWGLGPSFDCAIDRPCEAPQCSALKREDEASHYEQAAMLLASLANFNAVSPLQVIYFVPTMLTDEALLPDLRCA